MLRKDFITRQLDRVISDNSPTTLMGARGLLRFNRMPTWLVYLLVIAVVASWLPLAGAVRAKFMKSDKPPIHLFQDMDIQPRYGPQAVNPVFVNNMSSRPPIPGTVARGKLDEDDFYYRGYQLTGTTSEGGPEVDWFDGFPEQVTVDAELITRGKELWARYCYLCHGFDGYGNGPVHLKAQQNIEQNPNWIQPSSLHDDVRRERATGHIYNTINNGIRSMGPYGAQIPAPEDRWAIVAYVKALQLSQNAPADTVPEEMRISISVRPATINGQEPIPAEEEAGEGEGDEAADDGSSAPAAPANP